MNDESEITLVPCNDDDFRKGILSGEIPPHNVKITVEFKNGGRFTAKVPWGTIKSLYEYHNKCTVGEVYELLVENSL